MSACDASRDAIVRAAFGELDEAALKELRAHLETCAACADQAREVHEARRLVASAEGHGLPPAWLDPAAAGAVTASRWKRVLPMLAAALILAAAVAVLRPGSGLLGEPESGPLLASGGLGLGAGAGNVDDEGDDGGKDAYLGDDGLGDEIESLQSELAALESKVGEF